MGRQRLAAIIFSFFSIAGAFAAEPLEISQLVLLERAELAKLMADRVAFLPNGIAVIGGWLDWPQTPVVLCAPNTIPAMQVGLQAAAPRFAISPDGQRLALWKRVAIGGQERAQLVIVHWESQSVMGVGEPLPITPSLFLVWLLDGTLVYATEEGNQPAGALYAADLVGGKPRRLLTLTQGQWQELRLGAAPDEIYATWSRGEGLTTYALSCQNPSSPRIVSGGVAAPDGSGRTFEIDAQGALIVNVSPTEGVIADRNVRSAAWRPDGQAILYVKDKQLWITAGKGEEPRLLCDISREAPDVFLRGCAWAPDGVAVAFWGVAGASGRVWKATLGLERIWGRFFFAREAPVKAGDRLWIVVKFQRDIRGEIVEPVWSTLKAQFTVTRILRTPEGIVAEAINAGAQTGVIERLAAEAAPSPSSSAGHISIGVAGQTTTLWTRSRTLAFRPGLQAWLEKTKYVGQPQSLQIERQLLPPIAVSPAPAAVPTQPAAAAN